MPIFNCLTKMCFDGITFGKYRLHAARPSGGVAIVPQKIVRCISDELNTLLEAVAVRLLTDPLITVSSLYVPLRYSLTVTELQCLTDQLATPLLMEILMCIISYGVAGDGTPVQA